MAVLKKPTKIGAVDKHAITVSLDVAAAALEPDEYSYRAVFKEIMPKLYVMRHRGMSFPQLHKVMHQAGFPIALTTVRTYYNEFLVDMLDECQKFLKRMEKVIENSEKFVEVDRSEHFRQAKAAVRTAVAEAGDARAAAAISAITGGALMAPQKAEHANEMTPQRPAQLPEPSMGSGSIEDQAKPDPQWKSNALGRAAIKALDAPAQTDRDAIGREAGRRNAGQPRGSARCLTTPDKAQIGEADGLPPEVDSEDILEHPAIPELMLTRNQRLFIGRLSYISDAGDELIEKGTEMMNRREWTKAAPSIAGRTAEDFVPLDASLFKNGPRKD